MANERNAPAISIAMATFNGEQFLQQQLDSLADQTLLPSELVVCDDGSSDDTLRLIEDFSRTAPFPVVIHRNSDRLGYADNFFKAARLCSGDWVAFCDQDDVWLPNRLSDAWQAITQNSNALMILQNAFVCQKNLTHEGRLFPNKIGPGFYPPGAQYGFWVWPGFLKTVRADVFHRFQHVHRPKSYLPADQVMTHDKWTCMIVNATGGVVVLAKPAALYRRHEKALTGQYAKQRFGERIAKALPVGDDHYVFLSEVASETADYLRGIAEQADGSTARDLDKAAADFDRLARIQSSRSLIYDAGIAARIRAFLRVLWWGGYFGSPMTAMGWKSAGKDAVAAFGLLGNRKI